MNQGIKELHHPMTFYPNYIRRIFRIYSGIDTVPDINFKWSVRSESKAIRVSATNVVNSKYLAIKSKYYYYYYYFYHHHCHNYYRY